MRSTGCQFLLIGLFLASRAGAQGTPPTLTPVEVSLPEQRAITVSLEAAPPAAKTLLTELVRNHLPHDYDDERKWGGTRERWDGLKVSVDGLKIHTKRRRKTVNHGTWKKYHLELLDTDEHLVVKITDLQNVGPGEFGFQLWVRAKLKATGRRQEWNNGVRLFSISVDADADVEMRLEMVVATRLDAQRFPPDVSIQPTAKSAELRLENLEVNRISHADGPLVNELGDALEDVVRHIVAEKNETLVAKINRQFAKHQDKFHFSMQDWVQEQWLGIKPAVVDSPP